MGAWYRQCGTSTGLPAQRIIAGAIVDEIAAADHNVPVGDKFPFEATTWKRRWHFVEVCDRGHVLDAFVTQAAERRHANWLIVLNPVFLDSEVPAQDSSGQPLAEGHVQSPAQDTGQNFVKFVTKALKGSPSFPRHRPTLHLQMPRLHVVHRVDHA